MEHDDPPESAIVVLLHDIQTNQDRVAVLAKNVPGVASDSIELVDAARLDDPAARDLLVEASDKGAETVASAENVGVHELGVEYRPYRVLFCCSRGRSALSGCKWVTRSPLDVSCKLDGTDCPMIDKTRHASAVATRTDVTFASGSEFCGAWLYQPEGVERPPIIVMGHGFGAVRELRLDAYAERFAEAGYAVLVFDYRHFGASSGEPRELLSLSRQRADWRAALKYARSLPEVDPSRVIAWGSSLGGGHVLHIAASDPGLAAVVVQVPHVSGPVAVRSMGLRHVTTLGVAGLYDEARHLLGRRPYYRAGIGDTGSGAVMIVSDGLRVLRQLAGDSLTEADLEQRNRVAARVLLHMPFYSPGRGAHRITAPTLIQAGEHDELTPPSASRGVAKRIPGAEFKTYQCGHFDPYLPPHFEGVVVDQLSFLEKHVPVANRPDQVAAK